MKKGFLIIAGATLAPCLTQAQTPGDTARVVNLEQVTVTATRADNRTPVAQTTVNQQQIEAARIGREMPFLLELLPSVVNYSDNGTMVGSTSFRIRGTDASRINISIDGVPLNDAESQNVFWVNIPDLGAISKSLQVQRGVGTSPFGSSAFGGLLNIETRPAATQAGTQFETSYGAFNTWNAAANVATGLIKDVFAFDARYEYVSSDGYLEHSGLWQQTLYANGSWRNKNQLLKASLLYGEQHSMLTYEGVAEESLTTDRRHLYTEYHDGYYPNETDNYQQLHAHLHYIVQLPHAWKLNTAAYYTKGKGYYEQYKTNTSFSKYGIPTQTIDGTAYKKSDLIRRKGLDNDFYGVNVSALYAAERLNLTLGASANRYDGDHYGRVIWAQYNTGNISNNHNWYDNTGVKDEWNAFAKASYSLLESLSVFADMQVRNVRFNMHGMDDDYYEKPRGIMDTTYNWLFANPKIGVTYAPDKYHTAFVSFAVGNREPNRSDLKDADRGGVRTPAKAETLYDWEAGYTFRPTFGQFGINLYYMNYRDQIVSTGRLNDAYREIMENVPESYRAGIELTAAVRPLRQWQIEGTLTWSRNKLKNYTHYSTQCGNSTDWNYIADRKDFYKEVTIAYSPDIIAAAAVRWQPSKNLSLALTGKYVGKQFFDNTQTDSRSLDAYFVSNLQAMYDFTIAKKTNCFVQFAINNLFNAKYCTWAFVNDFAAFADGSPDYQELRYFPQAEINWMMKAGIKF
ncbi:MAG: TonB-dependent receptor [Prevotellaceae bacterium]|jgi:iron complex outermembrane receptor protein|nr:TonB-dependent receptor [Prevotellaceae bacterium]